MIMTMMTMIKVMMITISTSMVMMMVKMTIIKGDAAAGDVDEDDD